MSSPWTRPAPSHPSPSRCVRYIHLRSSVNFKSPFTFSMGALASQPVNGYACPIHQIIWNHAICIVHGEFSHSSRVLQDRDGIALVPLE